MNRYTLLSLSVLAALTTTPYAFAQSECDANEQQCETLQTLEKISVTATRGKTKARDYAGSIGILEPQQLITSSNIIETLGKIPGFENGGDSGRQIGAQYTIRGFGYGSESRVIVRQDGVPRSPSLFSNQISSFRTDANLIKRVEVVKGASSILYGSGAIGGIVEMQTKSAKDMLAHNEQLGGNVGLRYESNQMKSLRGSIYGRSESVPIDFMLYGKKAKHNDIDLADGGNLTLAEDGKTSGYDKIENDEEINTSYLSFGYDISEEQRLQLSMFDYDEKLDTVWQTLYFADIDEEAPIVGSLQQTDYTLNYHHDSATTPWLDLAITLYQSEAYYRRGWDYVDSKAQRQTLNYQNKDERYGVNIKNISEFTLANIPHTLLVGLEYNHREETAIYRRNGKLSDFGSMPANYNDWGLYLHDSLAFDQLTLTLAGRFDSFDREVKLPGKTDFDDQRFSPRVAMSYAINDQFNLLFGYAETFRAPTPHETSSEGALNPHYHYLPNPGLKAETAAEFETGFAFSDESVLTSQDHLWAKVSYFTGNIDDMIRAVRLTDLPKPEDASTFAQYQNVDNAKRKGYEVELGYIINNIKVDASFEHLDLYDKETKENVSQGFADKLQLALSYDHYPSGLSVSLDMEHWFKPDQNPATVTSRGKVYTYVDQTFTQYNLTGSYQLDSLPMVNSAKLNFGIKNLTDDKYINARNVNTTSRVGTGRNIYLDLTLSF